MNATVSLNIVKATHVVIHAMNILEIITRAMTLMKIAILVTMIEAMTIVTIQIVQALMTVVVNAVKSINPESLLQRLGINLIVTAMKKNVMSHRIQIVTNPIVTHHLIIIPAVAIQTILIANHLRRALIHAIQMLTPVMNVPKSINLAAIIIQDPAIVMAQAQMARTTVEITQTLMTPAQNAMKCKRQQIEHL
jgi:hypothetical protein